MCITNCHLLSLHNAARKYIKNQKSVRESIARMSSKPLFRIQDDISSHRQQLLLIASALQRSAVAIEKLKKETARVLFMIWNWCSVNHLLQLLLSLTLLLSVLSDWFCTITVHVRPAFPFPSQHHLNTRWIVLLSLSLWLFSGVINVINCCFVVFFLFDKCTFFWCSLTLCCFDILSRTSLTAIRT